VSPSPVSPPALPPSSPHEVRIVLTSSTMARLFVTAAVVLFVGIIGVLAAAGALPLCRTPPKGSQLVPTHEDEGATDVDFQGGGNNSGGAVSTATIGQRGGGRVQRDGGGDSEDDETLVVARHAGAETPMQCKALGERSTLAQAALPSKTLNNTSGSMWDGGSTMSAWARPNVGSETGSAGPDTPPRLPAPPPAASPLIQGPGWKVIRGPVGPTFVKGTPVKAAPKPGRSGRSAPDAAPKGTRSESTRAAQISKIAHTNTDGGGDEDGNTGRPRQASMGRATARDMMAGYVEEEPVEAGSSEPEPSRLAKPRPLAGTLRHVPVPNLGLD